MSDIKKIFEGLKSGKTLFILGLVGIILIGAGSLFPKKSSENATERTEFNSAEYIAALEKSVKKTVQNITGSRDVTVFITLEGGPRYTYGQDLKQSNEQNENESANKNETSFIIVTDSSGNENAIPVYEYYPEVRGVTVVYSGCTAHIEKIESAVTKALGITSKRISIINKGGT